MLILSRKKNQSIIINENIEVTVTSISKDGVRLGIIADENISIHRKEIFLNIQEMKQAAKSTVKSSFTENNISPKKKLIKD